MRKLIKLTRRKNVKNGISRTLELLIGVNKIFSQSLYFISYEKLKRSVLYIDGDPRRLSNRIHGLERSGYIKIDRDNKSVELTIKGRIKLIENSEDHMVDGKWRFLSWDIPEHLSAKRQKFCRAIRRIGFKQVQKSLWASPYTRSDEVYLIIDEIDIRKYISYILAEKTDIENHLNKLFPELEK